MAVPFALPEDEITNLIAGVIFLLSQVRIRQTENPELQECMEVLVRLLTEEVQRRSRSIEYDNQLRRTLFVLRQFLRKFNRTPPRRNNFDSYCDDCKMFFHDDCANEDCPIPQGRQKVDKDDSQEILQKNEELLQESFFSRFVVTVRRTFWTAIPLICIVGLHLFQISYFM